MVVSDYWFVQFPPLLRPAAFSQVAFDKLTVDSAYQVASAAAAATTAADQQATFGSQLAKATSDASNQRAHFDDQMAEAKLAAGDMKFAFDKLTLDNTDQKTAFVNQMAQAEQDAGGMKALLYDMLPQHVSGLNSSICQLFWSQGLCHTAVLPLCLGGGCSPGCRQHASSQWRLIH